MEKKAEKDMFGKRRTRNRREVEREREREKF